MAGIDDKIYRLNREQEERHVEETARRLKVTYLNLTGYPLTEEILSLVPEEYAIQYKIVPYLKVGRTLKIGAVNISDPKLNEFLDQFSKTIGLQFVTTLISMTSFYYGISAYEKIKKDKEQIIVEQKKEDEGYQNKISDLKSAADILQTANITKLFDVIVSGAISTNSSDIHIEPADQTFMIRYRIDGILQDVVSLPIKQFKQLVSRVKYMSALRMDIEDKPQDGRITIKQNGKEDIDLRVSLMPSTWGESVVIRLLGQEKSILSLDSLGIRSDALAAIKEAISRPYGMILTSGPTGSGKSSTLYAILMHLNKPGVKIITLENPVEYRIEGIEQSQIKPGAGYEFSDGLRASLRQDPDILMVGEIRDTDTAEIAVQAALTGHLLISTIHANSAPAVFPRLIEIGVKPFLLSGSVNLIMAQRLVRKVCMHCREKYVPRPDVWQEMREVMYPIKNRLSQRHLDILKQPLPQLVHGKGCEHCNRTGYAGRQLIIEVVVPNDQIESLIAKKATIAEFKKVAISEGMITMEQDGIMKALEGITTVEEVWRVTRS